MGRKARGSGRGEEGHETDVEESRERIALRGYECFARSSQFASRAQMGNPPRRDERRTRALLRPGGRNGSIRKKLDLVKCGWYAEAYRRDQKDMNLYEVCIHGTESIYLLAPTKYRALELVGDYMADAGWSEMMQSGNIVVRQLDLSAEQILRPEKCRACSLNA